MAQSWAGRPFGLAPLDFDGTLYTYGSSSAGRGGFAHPYHLSCLLAVAIGAAVVAVHRSRRPWPWPWCVGLAVCVAGMTVTFSRAGLIGMAAVLGVAAVGWVARPRRTHLLVAAAVVVGVAVGTLGFGSGWISRSSTTVDRQTVDSGRRDRAAEAVRLIRSEPVIGVGPGRYVLALKEVDHVELRPAHDLPLHVSAEAGLAVSAALALLARRCLRLGVVALSVFLPLVPFLLLDAFPYSWPQGLALSGVWLGLIGLATSDHRSGP
jgi:hypothetical protein